MIRRLLTNQEQLERLAVIEDGNELRYLELLQRAWSVQSHLPQGQQERAAILLPNGGDYIAALWGTVMSGMTAFPLHALMTGYEILPLLKQAAVSTIVTTTAYLRTLEEASQLHTHTLNLLLMDQMEAVTCRPKAAAVDVDTDKPMLLLSTSGTTGKSKIVQLSERNVETAVLGYLDKLCFRDMRLEDVRYTIAVPFSSVYGMMILSACLLRSFPIVILDHAFTLDALYRMAEQYKITHYEGSSSTILLMEQMAGRTIAYDIHTLKYFGFGGSKVSAESIDKLYQVYPDAEFYQGYGMTEAAPLITKHPQAKLEKAASVGTAINGVDIAVEAEDGITAVPYTHGEIVVRGPNVMPGYLDNEPETSRVLKNGYLYTGDIGYLDDEGYLYLCGRKKNVIIVRGFKVYPEEVEACIQNSALAKDCFVYGKTGDNGNETVCADIVPAHSEVGEDAVRAYCDAHLAPFKRPQSISFCASIRKNASGKTERH